MKLRKLEVLTGPRLKRIYKSKAMQQKLLNLTEMSPVRRWLDNAL